MEDAENTTTITENSGTSDKRQRQLTRCIVVSAGITSFFCVVQFCVRLPVRHVAPALVWITAGVLWPLFVWYCLRSQQQRLRFLWVSNLCCILATIIGLILSMVLYGRVFLDVGECKNEDDMVQKMSRMMSCKMFHVFMFLYIILSLFLLISLVVECVFTYELLRHVQRNRSSSSVLISPSQLSATLSTEFIYFPSTVEMRRSSTAAVASGDPYTSRLTSLKIVNSPRRYLPSRMSETPAQQSSCRSRSSPV